MKTYNERQIHSRINEINLILDEDEKTGSLTDDEFRMYWQELYKLEQDLVHLYIIRHLAKEHKMQELDLSLLPICDETVDSDMESCKERKEASYYFHKKVTACKNRGRGGDKPPCSNILGSAKYGFERIMVKAIICDTLQQP